MARVVLAMSGGVDSSVAAHLLREAGHEVIGLFMRHGGQSPVGCGAAEPAQGSPKFSLPLLSARPGHRQGCCSADDAEDARRVADRLKIPFYAVDFQAEFGQIIDYFVDEYAAGRTPNPCVMCNNWLKFGKLLEYADSVGAEFLATGHYARIAPDAAGGTPRLLRGLDPDKDQSYVLFGIDRAILPRVLLPVGGYDKPTIRRLAAELGLAVAEKQDSQEICFVTSGHYSDLVRARRGDADRAGELVTSDGAVVGRHTGIENFTIGQRKGLGVTFGEPRFVVRIEPETRRVVLGRREELARRVLTARAVNWLVDQPRAAFQCDVKIRYLSQPVAAEVSLLEHDRIQVELAEPRDGVAPGQALVCYAGDQVLGGGWIE